MSSLLGTSTNINLGTQTLEQCLKETSRFGSTEYVNICTGQINTVQWGNLDWFFVLGIIVFVGVVGLGFMLMMFVTLLDNI